MPGYGESMPELLTVLGLVVLLLGGEVLVRGAAALARRLALAPQLVGATVVAAATSTPELFASAAAALAGAPGLALGNALGSNIANIGLILGVTALLAPGALRSGHWVRDTAVLLGSVALLALLLLDGGLGRQDGAVLGVALVLALPSLTLQRPAAPVLPGPPSVEAAEAPELLDAPAPPAAGDPAPSPSVRVAWALVGVGTLLLVVGARLLVNGAVALAAGWGVSEELIGLTLVAVGTSLPELASSAVAAWRGEVELALGNVVGSNLFNTLAVLGAAALARPLALEVGHAALYLGVVALFSALLGALLAGHQAGLALLRGRGPALLLLAAYAAWVAALTRLG